VNCPQRVPTLPALRLGSSEGAEMPTVLIVDDCPAVRTTLRSLLEQQVSPVMCIEASNGIDAIAKAEVSACVRFQTAGLE